tara:strand:- start:1227 stop:1391 length:165 start_codon:yes stop_codon:yes gene_type:complete
MGLEEMSRASALLIGFGVLAMLTRSTLAFAPRRTIHFWMAIFATDFQQYAQKSF